MFRSRGANRFAFLLYASSRAFLFDSRRRPRHEIPYRFPNFLSSLLSVRRRRINVDSAFARKPSSFPPKIRSVVFREGRGPRCPDAFPNCFENYARASILHIRASREGKNSAGVITQRQPARVALQFSPEPHRPPLGDNRVPSSGKRGKLATGKTKGPILARFLVLGSRNVIGRILTERTNRPRSSRRETTSRTIKRQFSGSVPSIVCDSTSDTVKASRSFDPRFTLAR